jgi:hypothetical protein
MLAFGLVLFVALACNLSKAIRKVTEKEQPPKTLTSKDGKSQITVPGNWKEETELNKSASPQAANRPEEMYVIVIRDDRSDFDKSYSLEDFTKLTRDRMLKNVDSSTATEPTNTSINGNDALQYELRGKIQSFKAIYLNTTVETKDSFYQILTWTFLTKYDENKPILRKVISSFKNLEH